MHDPTVRHPSPFDTVLTFLFAATAALLGPLAGTAPRGMPVWILTILALSAALLVRRGGRVRPYSRTTITIAAFVALAAVSIAWSPSPRASLTVLEISYTALTALLAGMCIATLSETAAQRLGGLFVGGLLVGILTFAVESGFDYPFHHWIGNGVDNAVLAISNVPKRSAALLALLVWPAALVLRRRGWGVWALALPVAYVLMSLLQTSRSAMVGVFIGLVTFALATRWRTATRRALALLLAVAFIGAIPIAYTLDRIFGLDDAEWLFTSARHRVEIWWRAAHRALDTPFLGQGIDASRALIPRGETSYFETLTNSLLPLHPHNVFLQLWLELGAVGTALALAVLLLVLDAIRRLEPRDQPYALASFAAALGMAYTAYGVWQAWWMAGMLAAGLMVRLATRIPQSAS